MEEALMRKMMLFLTIICLSLSSFLFAQSGGTGANFLKIPVGPRPMGLGSAFTGVGDNVYTLYWNPAGIGFIRRWEISAMYNQYFADMYYGAISGLKQYEVLWSKKTAVGMSLFFHGMPQWGGEAEEEDPDASNLMAITSFGQRLDWLSDNLSIGLNVKFARSTLANYDAYMLATDFGILSRWDLFNHPFMIGAAIQNIGFQTKFISAKSPIPFGYRFGVSYRFINCDYHHLLLATDLAKYKYGNWKLGLGAEYWFRNLIAVRSGYTFNKDDMGDFSFGVGVKLDAFNSGLQSDYTQSDFGDALGYTRSGAVSLYTVSPEPFHLLVPDDKQLFGPNEKVELSWEQAEDPDYCDVVRCRILIDTDPVKLEQEGEKICKNPTANSQVHIDLRTTDPKIQLVDLPPDTYYWKLVAIDRKGHTRQSKEIRSFIKAAPDLIIEIAFQPNRILPDLYDSTQGEINISVTNIGNWTAFKFKVVLSDSYFCKGQDNFVKEFYIDSLKSRQVTPLPFTWKTNGIGKHRFLTVVDPDNRVFESNENNNKDSFTAVTIPRGRVFAEKDTLDTKKIVFSYCEIPIVPIVFFDEKSTVVNEDFYQEDVIKPKPMLKVIADRLIQNSDFKIQLAGYLDPITEKGNSNLALERMQQVYAILVDSLGVPSRQVGLLKDYDATKRRLERTPEPMVNAENRRVEILFDSDKPDEMFKLFGPLEIIGTPRISDGLVFHSRLKAFIDVTCWQLLIEFQDEMERQVIFRTSFRIDAITNPIDMIDTTVWIGRNNENSQIQLNRSYYYLIKVQDRLGREFTTIPQKFYLKCDFVENQQLQVHLNQFDSVNEFFLFGDKRLMQLADSLCKSPSMKIKFSGYACEIGTPDYNLNLAYERAKESRSRFLEILEKKNRQTYSTKVQQVDTLRIKDNYPGSYAEPIKYYNPCTLKEYIFPLDNAYGRNLSRRVDIVLYSEEKFNKK
jgi:outer membrane protein OmpA-like peptidoglycan-associated protein